LTFSPLHPQFTEAYIKDRLDGAVTKIDYEGRVYTVSVDPDYIPPYGGARKDPGGRPLGMKAGKQTYWSPDDEEFLIRQRMLNRPFAEIAWALSRSEEATKKHHHLLRARGRA
jgi:hypothetical protein